MLVTKKMSLPEAIYWAQSAPCDERKSNEAFEVLTTEIERLKACWAEALENVTTRNREIERLHTLGWQLVEALRKYSESRPNEPSVRSVARPLEAFIIALGDAAELEKRP
jgi:hypothetical protein